MKLMASILRRALLNSILFKSRGGWFNPARAGPSLIKANSAYIPSTISPVQNTAFPALCLTVGILHRCSIVQPSVIQLGNGQTRIVRDIHVESFQQEAQRTFAFFAHVFNFNTVSVTAAAGVVTYSSMQLFKNQRKANPDDFSFKPVLIFNGRRSSQLAFESNISQLHEIGINSYPLYENGDVDLPEGSLVTVGYTAHTYATKNHYRNITTGLSFDLAFVVLMALPPLAQIPRPVRTTFTYPFDEDYAYSTPRRNASALPASRFQFMSPATLPMHTPHRHNQRSLVSASSFDANMHPLSDCQLPPATSSPLPLSHDDLSTSPYPLIHSARPCPVAGTAQEAELEAELDFDDVLSLVHPSNY
ncbi:uncharacterized protein C8R40DRAFT_1182474 [Lentinula edodes]|uniref:uncharacterized protein n=1 Tax=Lentinula edodes TaxID=5353 RepID=UPI001E8D4A80|nr:uncharacterized protein C8R40DRAFT_1182474 [Lentinula edodes]KAH7867647.1 hypothetical protein C8R40DRAFT_1182474 [Lentinula edodes]